MIKKKSVKNMFSYFAVYFFTGFLFLVSACSTVENEILEYNSGTENEYEYYIEDVPEFDGEPYTVVNGNIPEFDEEDYTTKAFEMYSPKDSLGRCQTAYVNVCEEIMPDKEREDIGMIKPSGWHTVKYDFVDGLYLYNRCHLIGYQLSGENANDRNLITGTRYMNVQGMLPFENMVDDYVEDTGNHVLYRVTPVYEGNNLVADGVQMEGWSVEDEGEGICYNVFVYNNQPGIDIDYATGDSTVSEDTETEDGTGSEENEYVLNTNTMKFHLKSCSGAGEISDTNKEFSNKTREELIGEGYSPCGRCKP